MFGDSELFGFQLDFLASAAAIMVGLALVAKDHCCKKPLSPEQQAFQTLRKYTYHPSALQRLFGNRRAAPRIYVAAFNLLANQLTLKHIANLFTTAIWFNDRGMFEAILDKRPDVLTKEATHEAPSILLFVAKCAQESPHGNSREMRTLLANLIKRILSSQDSSNKKVHTLFTHLTSSEGFSVAAGISGKYADSTPYRMVLLEVMILVFLTESRALQEAFCTQLAFTSGRRASQHLQQFSQHVLTAMASRIAALQPLPRQPRHTSSTPALPPAPPVVFATTPSPLPPRARPASIQRPAASTPTIPTSRAVPAPEPTPAPHPAKPISFTIKTIDYRTLYFPPTVATFLEAFWRLWPGAGHFITGDLIMPVVKKDVATEEKASKESARCNIVFSVTAEPGNFDRALLDMEFALATLFTSWRTHLANFTQHPKTGMYYQQRFIRGKTPDGRTIHATLIVTGSAIDAAFFKDSWLMHHQAGIYDLNANSLTDVHHDSQPIPRSLLPGIADRLNEVNHDTSTKLALIIDDVLRRPDYPETPEFTHWFDNLIDPQIVPARHILKAIAPESVDLWWSVWSARQGRAHGHWKPTPMPHDTPAP